MELQKHYTTPEQSEKLLAMGIPANTADLYYERHSEIKFERLNIRLNKIELADDFFEKHSLYTPHWSVGRLIEIAFICSVYKVRTIDFWRNDTPIDDIIYEFENNKMDFSKLNES